MKNHDLKTHLQYFKAIWDNKKRFDVRFDDRKFEVGDTITLLEYNEKQNTYTGRSLGATISYKLDGGQFGLQEGYCVLSLDNIEKVWEDCSIHDYGYPDNMGFVSCARCGDIFNVYDESLL